MPRTLGSSRHSASGDLDKILAHPALDSLSPQNSQPIVALLPDGREIQFFSYAQDNLIYTIVRFLDNNHWANVHQSRSGGSVVIQFQGRRRENISSSSRHGIIDTGINDCELLNKRGTEVSAKITKLVCYVMLFSPTSYDFGSLLHPLKDFAAMPLDLKRVPPLPFSILEYRRLPSMRSSPRTFIRDFRLRLRLLFKSRLLLKKVGGSVSSI
ncbi:uncharacterized protein LAJ45_00434 [Morchella importuna]|uniref:uncharacterized protein n=1 Tax=Morchella importuna TaxID=1174673 RepID=UPI001E8D7F5A|nr:uncharacterized protein LAJ45_00434 [Morchella importuna]KAH8155424.1 hypothetical protein LAJ45_00434 [Morchella importuna]